MRLVLGITGATGIASAISLMKRSPWPIWLIISRHGKIALEKEECKYEELIKNADKVFEDDDMAAPIASGSTPTLGMIILPCTTNTLAKVSNGIADSLITRAAHCHLKEKRKLVLCVRESPWSHIDFLNAAKVSSAGAVVMPLSIPYYFFRGRAPDTVTMSETFEVFADRVLQQFGDDNGRYWSDSK